ncbi:MAG: metalloregulator ArsR/SmtB family transcription factor [Negativicutes bacterium]|nr:metalloregulator ArsR/SmtB family transcription factor [Negativicutes bacterium]
MEKAYALLFKALADQTRLEIVDLISCGELCACEILKSFSFTQSTLSYHMKLLTDSGLVNVRRDGKKMIYGVDPEKALAIITFWDKFTVKTEKNEQSGRQSGLEISCTSTKKCDEPFGQPE